MERMEPLNNHPRPRIARSDGPATGWRLFALSIVAAGIITALAIAETRSGGFSATAMWAMLSIGAGSGIALALVKQIAARIFGYEDRSLLEMATEKLGRHGVWAAGGLVATGSTAAGYGGPAMFPLIGLMGAEHVTNRTLNVVPQLPYHVKELLVTLKFVAHEYPKELKILGAVVAVGIGVGLIVGLMPGDWQTKLLVFGGLGGGLVAIGLVRAVLQKSVGRDVGDLSSKWTDADWKERVGKVALALGTLALFAATSAALFTGHLSPWTAYLSYGAVFSGIVWYFFPSVPIKIRDSLMGALKSTSSVPANVGNAARNAGREVVGY